MTASAFSLKPRHVFLNGFNGHVLKRGMRVAGEIFKGAYEILRKFNCHQHSRIFP